MFDTILPYKFVQRNKNISGNEQFVYHYVYRFFFHKGTSRRKYIVSIKEYKNKLFTVAFYAKTTNLHKYRITTKQFATGQIGGTVLAIMADVITLHGVDAFGIEAAALLDEETDSETKRFLLYEKVLDRKVKAENYKVFVIPDLSHIFVIRTSRVQHLKKIVKEYGKIFRETQQ